MKIFGPVNAEQWNEIRSRGFFNFYLEYIVSTAAIGIVVFSLVNFLVYYEQQTYLMRLGIIWSGVFPPIWGAVTWQLLKRRYVGNRF